MCDPVPTDFSPRGPLLAPQSTDRAGVEPEPPGRDPEAGSSEAQDVEAPEPAKPSLPVEAGFSRNLGNICRNVKRVGSRRKQYKVGSGKIY